MIGGNKTYDDLINFLKDSLKANTLNQSKLFTRKRIKLDQEFSINDDSTLNSFKSDFRGFWVVDSSDRDFEVNMFPNIQNNYGDLVPLRHNMSFDFGELVNGCKFEFEAQAGKWIDILFFHRGFAQIGTQELEDLELSLGTIIENEVETITPAGVAISQVDEKNKKITISNIGQVPLFVGSQSDVASVDFDNLCEFLPPSYQLSFDGTKQIYLKTFGGHGMARVTKEK